MRPQDIWPELDYPSSRSFSYGRTEAEKIVRGLGKVLVFTESLGGLGDDSYLMVLVASPDRRIGFVWVRYAQPSEVLPRSDAERLVSAIEGAVTWFPYEDARSRLDVSFHGTTTYYRELARLYEDFKPLAFAALADMREAPPMIRQGRKRVMPP